MYTDKKLKEYNEREERFRLAINEATSNRSASINSIANKYRVSRTTLSRRIHGFKNTRTSHEKQQKFTNEEEQTIVGRIQEILKQSDQIPPKKDILLICERVLKDKYQNKEQGESENLFKVGKNWIDRFLERHNDKLMVNSGTTLSEYYKSEFLQRKKLRSDRGYKTSSSSTPAEEFPSTQQPQHYFQPLQPHVSVQQEQDAQQHQQLFHHQHHQHQQQHQHHQQQHQIHQPHLEPHIPPRLPYQSQSDPLIYQNVEQVPVSSIGYGVGYLPQAAGYGQEWPLNNFQQKHSVVYPPTGQQNYSYTQAPTNPQQPQPPQQQQQQQPPSQQPPHYQQPSLPRTELSTKQQSSTSLGNYSGSSPYSINNQVQPRAVASPVVSNLYPDQTAFQVPSTTTSGGGFNTFSFNQPTYTNSENLHRQSETQSDQTQTQPQQINTDEQDFSQFYQGQRFLYDDVKQRILKEFEEEPVDIGNVTKLINLTFSQIDRDLNANYVPTGY